MVISNYFLSTFSKSINSIIWRIFFISTVLKITSKWNATVRNNKTNKPFPPGPKSWPILGSLPQMLLNKNPAFHNWIHKIMEEMDTEIACIRLGNVHVIPVTSPDSVFSSRPICMSASLISNGYLTSVFLPIGDQWDE
ncbi:putative agamous-like MADS-box protein AGL86-like [Capsicum annuum]|uniref:Uncharacterized protein n=1 Tax=Capsicum annuum TaxID=4072 RepID=A0A2G3AD06_CAPAN|nr:putative agamous-like MADS-box protein AGL86-like [Capsicum annuum]KAF3629623.1 putative agamous-like MADS-box protein AGL86-like [Capsicum annuum]PHT92126.1 hypothetical protein T459_00008 [Capsicum annuum]